MNIHDPNIATPKVTTGPLIGSRKVYRILAARIQTSACRSAKSRCTPPPTNRR